MYKDYAKIRDEKGLTDYAVSKASGVSTATLTSWKQGIYTPKVDKVKKLADALGVKVSDLIGEAL